MRFNSAIYWDIVTSYSNLSRVWQRMPNFWYLDTMELVKGLTYNVFLLALSGR
jgi:hypothetical protein